MTGVRGIMARRSIHPALATLVGTGRGLSAPLLQLPYVAAQILAAGLAPVRATAVARHETTGDANDEPMS